MRRALLGAMALIAATVMVPASPAGAACDAASILGPVKTSFRAATRMRVDAPAASEAQYRLILAGRAGLDAAGARIETECATDGFHRLGVSETNTVYRAWNDGLGAGRALELSREQKECAADLRTVASAAVTSGWVLLDRVFHERPRPDSFATVQDLLRERARDLRITLSPLGNNRALDTMVTRHRSGAFGAGASLPPTCSRY